MARELTAQNKRDAEILKTALQVIKNNGGEMRYADLKAELPKIFQFNERELKPTKTWNALWHAILGMIGGIEMKAAGFVDIKNGIWSITKDGENALALNPDDFYNQFHNKWLNLQRAKRIRKNEINNRLNELPEEFAESDIESIQIKARENIKQYIINKDPYQFQNLIAALLRGMGYYTPFIAPKGRDGGIDIIAYEDPLGAKGNHIKVQVKHHPDKPISIDIISRLGYAITKTNEIAIVATSGRFSSECHAESRRSSRPIKLLDIEDIIDLWISFYPQMTESDKSELPIIPIYYLNTDKS